MSYTTCTRTLIFNVGCERNVKRRDTSGTVKYYLSGYLIQQFRWIRRAHYTALRSERVSVSVSEEDHPVLGQKPDHPHDDGLDEPWRSHGVSSYHRVNLTEWSMKGLILNWYRRDKRKKVDLTWLRGQLNGCGWALSARTTPWWLSVGHQDDTLARPLRVYS